MVFSLVQIEVRISSFNSRLKTGSVLLTVKWVRNVRRERRCKLMSAVALEEESIRVRRCTERFLAGCKRIVT